MILMQKIITLLGVAILLICVGLSGCIENDDDSFLIKADAIIDYFYPITISGISYKGQKATSYRLELADYSLSPECEEIRDDIDWILNMIQSEYDLSTSPYYTTDSSMINLLNLELGNTRGNIMNLQNSK